MIIHYLYKVPVYAERDAVKKIRVHTYQIRCITLLLILVHAVLYFSMMVAV